MYHFGHLLDIQNLFISQNLLMSLTNVHLLLPFFSSFRGMEHHGNSLKAASQETQEGIIKKDETVTFIVTGNGLKDPNNAQKAIIKPELMEPDINKLDIYLKGKGVI